MSKPHRWGLGWRLRATRRVWKRGLHPASPMLESEPRVKTAAGTIDRPAPNRLLERAAVDIEGWVIFPYDATSRIEISLGGHPLGRARLHLPRPDVRESTNLALGATSGFSLTTDLADWPGPDGYTDLTAVAVSVTGERLELAPVPVTVSSVPVELPSTESGAPPATPQLGRGDLPGRRVLVCTHQLDLGGAQIYLHDLLTELIEQEAVNPTVMTAIDGPLRVQLEQMGVPVLLSGAASMGDFDDHVERVGEMTAWAADRDFEAVFINTATALAFHGAEIASNLEIPAVWSIHESFKPPVLWDNLEKRIRERAEAALGEAAAAVFEAEATQRLFESRVGDGRSFTIPYGLDLEPTDSRRDGFDREEERRKAGIPADAEVLLCVGTIEPRKAQLAQAQAFELIAERHPHAHLIFVGGRDNAESRALGNRIATSEVGDRMRLVPITPDVQRWHGMSDVLVSASDIESLPRTVLESMAWEVPVLATSVFGLPELIDDGETGWLCEPRDTEALARGMDRVLSSSAEERAAIGRAARTLIERRHSLPNYGREIAALLDRVAAEPLPVSSGVAIN